MRVTLYTKPGCSLCDELKPMLWELEEQLGFTLVERNIETSSADNDRFRYLIPVVDIEGGSLLYPPHDWNTLQTALRTVRSK